MKSIALALILFSVAFVLNPSNAYAQAAESSIPPASAKIGVYISCTCEDQVGALYASALRDVLARSPRFKEVSEAEEKGADGKVKRYYWVLSIVSLDEAQPSTGMSTAISVVMNLGNTFFLTQWIQTCGREVVTSCAASTLADFDSKLHK